jgi:hypothetical protein
MCWCFGQIRQRDLAGTAPVGRHQHAVLERRTPAPGSIVEFDPQRVVIQALHGTGCRGPEVRLLVDPLEVLDEDVGLHREDVDERMEQVVGWSIGGRHSTHPFRRTNRST